MAEYKKHKFYVSRIGSSENAVELILDSSNPKLNVTKNDLIDTRSGRDNFTNESEDVTEEYFELSALTTIEHQRKTGIVGTFDIDSYDDIFITDINLGRTSFVILDQYDYVGTVNATINGGAQVQYGAWLRMNRFGCILYGQLHESGQPNALKIVGFLNIGNVNNFMANANGASPNFFEGPEQKIKVIEQSPPLEVPAKSAASGSGEPPTILDHTVSVESNVSASVSVLVGAVQGDDPIDITSVHVQDKSISSNFGNEENDMTIPSKGTFTINDQGIVNFTPLITFEGTIIVYCFVFDDQLRQSNKTNLKIIVTK